MAIKQHYKSIGPGGAELVTTEQDPQDSTKGNQRVASIPNAPVITNGSGSTTITDILIQDVGQITDCTVHLQGTWTGTITFQGSNDGTNYLPTLAYPLGSSNTFPSTAVTANNLYFIPTPFKWLRVKFTTPTSGTPSAYFCGNRQTSPFLAVGGSVALTSGNTISLAPRNTGGATQFRRVSTADTNLANVKSSAATLYQVIAYNSSAATKYVKIYNKATAPTLASDTPYLTIPIPATTMVNHPIVADIGGVMGTGLSIAITGGLPDTDATAVAAGDVYLTLFYN